MSIQPLITKKISSKYAYALIFVITFVVAGLLFFRTTASNTNSPQDTDIAINQNPESENREVARTNNLPAVINASGDENVQTENTGVVVGQQIVEPQKPTPESQEESSTTDETSSEDAVEEPTTSNTNLNIDTESSEETVNTNGAPTNGNSNQSTQDNYIWPVSPQGGILQEFTYDPKSGSGVYVMQIATTLKTPVKASRDGVVIRAVEPILSNYSYVAVQHDDDLITIYGALSDVSVSVGDSIGQGKELGLSGGLGQVGGGSFGPGERLDFSVRNSITYEYINPRSVLPEI